MKKGLRKLGPIDKRNRLDDEPFSYRIAKNNTIFLDYLDKQVKMLKGNEAEKFLQKINAAKDRKEVQLILAKITGNFKRGNERLASSKKQEIPLVLWTLSRSSKSAKRST